MLVCLQSFTNAIKNTIGDLFQAYISFLSFQRIVVECLMQRTQSVFVVGPWYTQILDSTYEVISVQLFRIILCPLAKLLEIGLNTFPCRSCPEHDIFEQLSTLRLRREPRFSRSNILISLKGVPG